MPNSLELIKLNQTKKEITIFRQKWQTNYHKANKNIVTNLKLLKVERVPS